MPSEYLRVAVECYAGHRGEETPRRFRLSTHPLCPIEVAEVLDRWLSPEHRYFKLRGSNGHTYILRNDTTTGDWELTMFARG